MRGLVRRGMEEGAFGLSSGLFYTPGSYSKTEEVIELTKAAAERGGLYTSHIRDEGNYNIGVVAAVQEVIRIAEEAKTIGVVSHAKALGPDNWGLAHAITQRIEVARARGVQVFTDQYRTRRRPRACAPRCCPTASTRRPWSSWPNPSR